MLPSPIEAVPVELSGTALFLGDETCLTVGLLMALRAIRSGQPLLVVDGANAFDPFLIATLARKAGLPPKVLLDEVRISRVFTCHQLEALISGRIQRSLRQCGSKTVLFSGLLDALLDEDVSSAEAHRIFALIPPLLRGLSADGVVPLCVCPPLPVPAGRERFLSVLKEIAEWMFHVSTQGEVVHIHCTKPRSATWTWEPTMGLLVARRWW